VKSAAEAPTGTDLHILLAEGRVNAEVKD
jgi:hypothetical protein